MFDPEISQIYRSLPETSDLVWWRCATPWIVPSWNSHPVRKVLRGSMGSNGDLMGFNRIYQDLMGFNEIYIMGFNGIYLDLMGI